MHEKLAKGLFNAMERPELIDDPRFATRDVRVANAAVLETMITNWSKTMKTQTVVDKLEAEGVPVAPVRHPEEAMRDPRVTSRNETAPVAHPAYEPKVDMHTAGIPISFSEACTGFDDVLPILVGEHNDYILREKLGYSEEKIANLRRKGII